MMFRRAIKCSEVLGLGLVGRPCLVVAKRNHRINCSGAGGGNTSRDPGGSQKNGSGDECDQRIGGADTPAAWMGSNPSAVSPIQMSRAFLNSSTGASLAYALIRGMPRRRFAGSAITLTKSKHIDAAGGSPWISRFANRSAFGKTYLSKCKMMLSRSVVTAVRIGLRSLRVPRIVSRTTALRYVYWRPSNSNPLGFCVVNLNEKRPSAASASAWSTI
jgi:hypothetical protein